MASYGTRTGRQLAAPRPSRRESLSDWHVLTRLVPYLWQYRVRMALALALVAGAKVANVAVPLLLKALVDRMNVTATDPRALAVVPVALLLGYGALRLLSSVFTELREWVFSKATQGATRRVALQTFEHLHALSLRFHLARQTGGLTRDIERGVRGVEALVTYTLYSILPTLIEVALVLFILGSRFDMGYVWIAFAALAVYVAFTIVLTEWRMKFRIAANRADSEAQNRAVDSLLNYETVKYFGNEQFEAQRYDTALRRYQHARLKAQTSLSLLNSGQQLIISAGLIAMLWRATLGVANGQLTIGDLVMVNAFMIQLYVPLNFLGSLYRQIKQSLIDLHRMFTLMDRPQEVLDTPQARPLRIDGPVSVRFEHVSFGYDADRQILHDVSFEIPAGQTVAVVGASGAGKSTLARLLYRFYDVGGTAANPGSGRILIAGQDIRQVTQASLRQAVGIVPQDTVLFNETIAYNIRYGRVDASDEELEQAARAARIHDFVMSTPRGYATEVGERGLKLSGGEKQRVAIARTLLKNPPVVIFDEATSALDSANERAIQAELEQAAVGKTTLIIAHRLSTVVHAHEILVMDAGRIVERGTHEALLAQGGRYARMWALQQNAGDNSLAGGGPQ